VSVNNLQHLTEVQQHQAVNMVHVADAVASGLVEAASSIHVNIDVNDNYIANYLYVTT